MINKKTQLTLEELDLLRMTRASHIGYTNIPTDEGHEYFAPAAAANSLARKGLVNIEVVGNGTRPPLRVFIKPGETPRIDMALISEGLLPSSQVLEVYDVKTKSVEQVGKVLKGVGYNFGEAVMYGVVPILSRSKQVAGLFRIVSSTDCGNVDGKIELAELHHSSIRNYMRNGLTGGRA